MSANRAAWLMSGRKAESGQVIYRNCCNPICINPKHLKQGTKAQMHAHYSASGKNKNQPHRRIANAKSRLKMMCSPERVQQCEALLKEGKLAKEIRAALQMDGNTIKIIREGRHVHSSTAGPRVLPGASVFQLGAV